MSGEGESEGCRFETTMWEWGGIVVLKRQSVKSIISRDASAVLQPIFRRPRMNTLRAGAGGELQTEAKAKAMVVVLKRQSVNPAYDVILLQYYSLYFVDRV